MSDEYQIAENIYIDAEERNLRNDFALTASLTALADFCNRQSESIVYANAIVDGWKRKVIAGRQAASAAVDKIAWPDDPAHARKVDETPEMAISDAEFESILDRTTEGMRGSLLDIMETMRRLSQ